MAPRRLVRRAPLLERVKAYLNPLDFLLWLSEVIDTSDWDQWQKDYGTPLGVGLNFIMLIARANSGRATGTYDDVFEDSPSGTGWMGWLATFVVYLLSWASFLNAAYTFYRKRHYRLFEASVDAPPSTPSARRVKVDSSPASSSPLRLLQNLIADNSAESRVHPDANKDVWELSVWDPLPFCLKMFCLFSPGHILVYWMFLPTLAQNARPSVTVAMTIILIALMSMQLSMLQSSFSQQAKDSTLIHREVLNEYDIKYVRPNTQPIYRDVATQFTKDEGSVQTYSPVVVVNRGFHTNPNTNYINHVDPEGVRNLEETPSRRTSTFGVVPLQTPAFAQRDNFAQRDLASPIRPQTAIRQHQQPLQRSSTGLGDGGSLGVYSHAHSPLKKSASSNFSGGGLRELARSTSPVKGSPLKRSSVAGGGLGAMSGASAANPQWSHLRRPHSRRETGNF